MNIAFSGIDITSRAVSSGHQNIAADNRFHHRYATAGKHFFAQDKTHVIAIPLAAEYHIALNPNTPEDALTFQDAFTPKIDDALKMLKWLPPEQLPQKAGLRLYPEEWLEGVADPQNIPITRLEAAKHGSYQKTLAAIHQVSEAIGKPDQHSDPTYRSTLEHELRDAYDKLFTWLRRDGAISPFHADGLKNTAGLASVRTTPRTEG